jgi:Type II restriction endonuclease, TdeIII
MRRLNFTSKGKRRVSAELKVANEFWDFVGGEGAYEGLLTIFERVGIELISEIDEYFERFNPKRP